MSQVITNAFETYWQDCLTDQMPVVLDEVVLADIPNLDITAPIDPNTGLPPQAQIVYRHPEPPQRGRINNNAVAYSIVMDTTVGNFSFNAMYLINKASGMVGMIVYKGRETKTKTDPATGTTGNSLVKSMLMEYDQAAAATVTTVEAGTWQIDYSARLLGMDEQLRLQAIACFGSSVFFGDGFKLINKAGSYKVQPGVAMVGGLRIQLDAEQAVTVGAKPVGVWVDVHHAGTILSRWDNHFEFKTST
ncbi:MAG: phage tail protein, partial [Aeromonas jandaei]